MLDVGPDLGYVGRALGRGGTDGDGLNEELVAASSVCWRILLHRLEENLDLDIAVGLDAAGVGAHAVSGGVDG